jgi:type IV pilus assembly protein PilO
MALFGLNDKRTQIFALITVLGLAGLYGVYSYLYQPTAQQAASVRAQLDTIDAVIRMAKAELAKGSRDNIEREVGRFRGMLAVMRQLVPEKNEVPTLIDDVSNRAKMRGVNIGRMQPLAVEPGAPFDTYRYRLDVYGRFDQVGEFLSDVASLPRIIVPEDLTLKPAQSNTQRLLADTSGALIEASFSMRTFVKSSRPAPAAPKK